MKFNLQEPSLIEVKKFSDDRGFFTQRITQSDTQRLGLPEFKQENISRSFPGVLRGLHFQKSPMQGKLLTCVTGKIFDVAVDLRRESKSFGQSFNYILDSNEPSWVWIPPGFAHGFLVLDDSSADIWYRVTELWNPSEEYTIAWNDKSLNIKWPQMPTLISDKDQKGKSFAEACNVLEQK